MDSMKFEIKEVQINTCSKIHERLYKTNKLYKHCSPHGLDLKVKYAESNLNVTEETPTVLALHGINGSIENFSSMINDLTIAGMRVIVPNFPGNLTELIINILNVG